MKKNTKIAIVSTLMPETHYTRYLIDSLADIFHETDWYAYANKAETIDPLNSNITLRQCWQKNFLYPAQVIKQAIKDKINVIHLQHEINMYGGPVTVILFPVLVLFLKLVRKKTIVTIHGVVLREEIDLNFLKTFSVPKNKFIVITMKIMFSYIYRTICLFSDIVIVHSNYIKSVLLSEYRVKEHKVKVISHGVPERTMSQETEKIKTAWREKVNDKKVILYFGYLVRRKGLEYLIDAFEQVRRKHQDYVLVLAGGTLQEDYVKELEEKVKEKEMVDEVVFTGFISEKELESFFILAEFVVLPAVYSISASGPLAQAISFYKPVIGTRLGTFCEEINNDVDGLLCPPRDARSLKNTMNRLIENPELLARMSGNMKKKAEERAWTNTAKKTYELYMPLKNRFKKEA